MSSPTTCIVAFHRVHPKIPTILIQTIAFHPVHPEILTILIQTMGILHDHPDSNTCPIDTSPGTIKHLLILHTCRAKIDE